MRFVRGDSLKEAIERFHAPARPSRPGVAGAESAKPRSAGRATLANGLRLRAWLKHNAGDAARRSVGLLEGLPNRDARQWFWLASARATLAAAAGRSGSGVSAAEAQALADRAVDDLRRAAAAGYRNVMFYRAEPSLDGLRGRDDFRLLMMDVAMPAEPFAR